MGEFIKARPEFPKRAIITAGMPYGNKDVHFGYVFGMALQADILARFLKCRIGEDNVIFLSGTDCYGSPLLETYRKKVQTGEYTGTIEDMVKEFHAKQEESIKMAQIGFDFFGASAFGEAKEEHEQVSKEFFEAMYKSGALKLMDTEQFFDTVKGVFINGRQVVGKCPIENCQSAKAYSDECELGHQYLPKDLINPKSTLSDTTPILKKTYNWYFDMLKYNKILTDLLEIQKKDRRHRKFVSREISEFLKLPEIYILRKEQMDKWDSVKDKLPKYVITEDDEKKPSFTIQFEKLEDRESACKILSDAEIRYRNGKTLVPFRITGNCEWGVPCEEKDGVKDLTFYVWPESLWAPISFTRTFLKNHKKSSQNYRDWWCSKDAEVYQFLAEDNAYFYGPPQEAMYLSTQGENPTLDYKDGDLKMTNLVVSKHSLFMGAKASSSGAVKAPLARELLEHYTPEQMRMHYLAKNLGDTNANFTPKVYNVDAKEEDKDPALVEGNLLINVYNRILRKYSYVVNDYFDGKMPVGEASDEVKEMCKKAILDFEDRMYCYKFHIIYNIYDNLLRNINKFYDKNRVELEKCNRQLAIDLLYMIRVANTLLYPTIPNKTIEIANYFGFNNKWLSWDYIFDEVTIFMTKEHIDVLEDETPFFKSHI